MKPSTEMRFLTGLFALVFGGLFFIVSKSQWVEGALLGGGLGVLVFLRRFVEAVDALAEKVDRLEQQVRATHGGSGQDRPEGGPLR